MHDNKNDLNIASAETISRKDSHLELALHSQNTQIDPRFYYEPFMSAHPQEGEKWIVPFGDKKMDFPLWISSMTGGTSNANEINKRLAKAVKAYGLGMGVGSARIALEDTTRTNDFQLRPILGDAAPFYLNFGIAQLEKYLQNKEAYKLDALREKLDADGIIIHVNPLQEWMQPMGDRIKNAPIETITRFLEKTKSPLIVKEVGQGFGPEGMKALLQLPLVAIEFAAAGGTNFSKLELMRSNTDSEYLTPFVSVGQSAGEMTEILNELVKDLKNKVKCQGVIISGGIKNFLDGYYYIQKANINAVYGQASQFLKHAMESQEALDTFVKNQAEGLLIARSFLKIKK